MQPAASAKRHQRELPRIVTALDGHQADRPLHIGISHAQNPLSRLHPAKPQPRRHRVHCRRRPRRIQHHRSAQQRCDPPQNHMGIGHSSQLARAVTGWPGNGPCALRTHAQQPALVHPRNGTAARAHSMDVQHRHPHREAIHTSFHRHPRTPLRQANVGGSSTHVKAQYFLKPGEPRHLNRAHHAARRARKQRSHRLRPCFRSRYQPAVRLHDGDPASRPCLQRRQIPVHQRTHICVQQRSGSPLIFAKLRTHLMRCADVNAKPAQRIQHRHFVLRIPVSMQEAHRHCLNAGAR